MPRDEEYLLELKVLIAELKETLRHIEKRLETHDSELKSLHRENSKQAEEIRDATYLADSIRVRFDEFTKVCHEHKTRQTMTSDKMETTLQNIQQGLNNLSMRKIVTIVQAVLAVLITAAAIVGYLSGWIKVGG